MAAHDSQAGGRSRILAWTAILVIAIPILYVLSTGPVFWVVVKCNGFNSPLVVKTLFVFYAPLNWPCEHCSWFKTFLDAYYKLFGLDS